MFLKKKRVEFIYREIQKISKILEKGNLVDLIYILGNKKEIIVRNFLAGIFRGVGIGIGVTVITAVLILILNRIVNLNIPIIGEYIADIVDIVEKSR